MSIEKQIGEKILSLRMFKNIPREEVADQCEMTTEQLKSIEEKGIVPSLGVLIKIARALGVRLGTFLDGEEDTGPVISRKNQQQQTASFSNKNSEARTHLDFYNLAENKAGRHMEPFVVDIKPSRGPDYILSSHEGEEFIYVLNGNVEITYGNDTFTLEQGDSIYYDSIISHHVHAAGDQPAQILGVIYTPY
ncbi:MAG: cupin domain-containing protein [Bacteroidales bacterium]|nr:cupin domain-containing protein [Bacteroidales bacterium]